VNVTRRGVEAVEVGVVPTTLTVGPLEPVSVVLVGAGPSFVLGGAIVAKYSPFRWR
jgi:hypothetical protein